MTLGETFWSFGVFFKPLESDFGWSRALTSSAYTAFLIGHAISLIIGGRLVDRFSPRPILLASAAIAGLGIALCSQTQSINQLCFFLFIAGLGAGPTWSVSTTTVMRWFSGHKRAGLALAITTTGVGVGAVVFAPLINHLIRSYGWRDAFLYVGVILFVIIAISALMVRRSPPAAIAPVPSTGDDAHESPTKMNRLPNKAQITPFLIITSIITVAIVSFQAVNVHFIPHAIDEGISDVSAAAALGLIGGFSILGRLVSGFISDAVGWRKTLALALFGMTLSIPWLLFLSASWMLYVFAFSYGVCHGIRVPAQLGILEQTFGISSLGQLIGISTAIGQVCGAAAPYAAGFIYDQTGSYSIVFFILMAILTATAIMAARIKEQP